MEPPSDRERETYMTMLRGMGFTSVTDDTLWESREDGLVVTKFTLDHRDNWTVTVHVRGTSIEDLRNEGLKTAVEYIADNYSSLMPIRAGEHHEWNF